MYIQFGVKVISLTYIVLGILGFLPIDAINPMHHEGVGAHYLLNLVAINWLHNVIHLSIGVFGLWGMTSLDRARVWGRVVGVVLLAVCAAGLVQAAQERYPVDQLLLGIVPLNSPGHMLHLATGTMALYLGFARRS